MFQNPFYLLPEATGHAGSSIALAAGPSLTAPAAHADEAVPTSPLPPVPGKHHRPRSVRQSRSEGTAANLTPFLTVLAGAAQWLYYPASRPGFSPGATEMHR
jgi:hypothetical protein